MGILDKAKPQKLYNLISWERWYRAHVAEQVRKDIEARRLALLSIADPHTYKIKQEK